MTINAYPLQWPDGWPRSVEHTSARFSKGERKYSSQPCGGSWVQQKALSVIDGISRVLDQLEKLGIDRQDAVISTNIRTRLDGLPRSGEREPDDSGVAVYWIDRDANPRVMAIDRYDRVADNLAAIAATLDALRAIERHGGGQILERAFTGFTALPSPESIDSWRNVLGVPDCQSYADAKAAYKRLCTTKHPDRGGTEAEFIRITLALTAAEEELVK